MDLIPIEERNKWTVELKPILTEMNKLSGADKIQGFRNEVVDKYVTSKALNYVLQQLTLVDCDLEMSEKENKELRYKIDNLGKYDEDRLKEFSNKIVTVPSTDQEIRNRHKKTFIRNQARMKMLNKSVTNT